MLYCRYIVGLYSFMRLMGYPAERISILTTYNGQKDLLRDVIEARCARHPLIGRPHKVGGWACGCGCGGVCGGGGSASGLVGVCVCGRGRGGLLQGVCVGGGVEHCGCMLQG